MPHRRLATLLAALTICAATALPVTALSYERLAKAHPPVVETGAQEFRPAADGESVAWMANTPRAPEPLQRVLQPERCRASAGQSPWHARMDGWCRGPYSSTPRSRRRAEVFVLYDMASDTTTPLPDGVNTGRTGPTPASRGTTCCSTGTGSPAAGRSSASFCSTPIPTRRDRARRGRQQSHVPRIGSGERQLGRLLLLSREQLQHLPLRHLGEKKEPRRFPTQVTSSSTHHRSAMAAVFFVRSPPRCGHNIRFMSWDGAATLICSSIFPRVGIPSTPSSTTARGVRCTTRGCAAELASDIYSEPVP